VLPALGLVRLVWQFQEPHGAPVLDWM